MLGLDMLDVAIGIVFIFLLLSLICSAINELVESELKLRAVDLDQGIRELLKDYTGTQLAQKIYNHPLIYSLFRGDYDPAQMRINKHDPQKNRYSRGSDLPSYIPASNFALALMDVLLPSDTSSANNLSGSFLANASKNDNAASAALSGTNPLQPLRNAVSSISNNNHVQQALLTIIDAAGNDAAKVKQGIEAWFNSSMDRVSGWYKRRVQKIVFIMGFAVAIFINTDTIAIFNNLSNDRPLRNSIVAQAQAIKGTGTDTTTASIHEIKKNINGLLELGLPIGWSWKSSLNPNAEYSNLNAIPKFNWQSDPQGSSLNWFLKMLGWFITGIAVSLGAPFWFDILNKIMVVRSTVKPNEKSPNEASDDRQNPQLTIVTKQQ